MESYDGLAAMMACEKQAAIIRQLVEALEPFVQSASHTMVFLSSRQKMHEIGQGLYRDDVTKAAEAIAQARAMLGEAQHG